jgi:hypothetical protein
VIPMSSPQMTRMFGLSVLGILILLSSNPFRVDYWARGTFDARDRAAFVQRVSSPSDGPI